MTENAFEAMGRKTAIIKNAIANRIIAGDTTPLEVIISEEKKKADERPKHPRELMEDYLRDQAEKHLPT